MINNPLYTKLAMLPADLQQKVEEYVDQLASQISTEKNPTKRTAGLAKGLIEMKPDFDQPLDDFKEYES
ncbi:MAG TPA: hypothetical protein DCE41_09980 [Cytophagales bacterium]|nr:hypothetical protein [Cytophagales bacterium]HAP64768.1 hypothetical protein [Cytophagales bacterium]